MTSEVVVMNRIAVALAADSAATVGGPGHGEHKIYNSADKLFMLSRRHPVGVMVYGNSTLVDIPWETIIKMFRQQLGDAERPYLAEYGKELRNFLTGHPDLFPIASQKACYIDSIQDFLTTEILEPVEDEILEKITQEYKNVEQSEGKAIAAKRIRLVLEKLQKREDSPHFTAEDANFVAGQDSDRVHRVYTELFGTLRIEKEQIDMLAKLVRLFITKDYFHPDLASGVVIAGFGKKEHFPVMESFDIGGVYRDRLKFGPIHREEIGLKKPSIIVPYAQSEMVRTFLSGMSTEVDYHYLSTLMYFIKTIPKFVLTEATGFRGKKLQDRIDKVTPMLMEATKATFRDLLKYKKDEHAQPIIDAIRFLPKDQLAHVASSLVNLNSFQKRMSLHPETVGGPIDVAVISKGDGFVWIERKHYFRKDLNPHYFRNIQLPGAVGGVTNEPKATPDDGQGDAGA